MGTDTPAEDSVDATSGATKTSSAAGTTTDSVTDPRSDQYQSFDDLDPIDPSRTRDGVSGQDVLDKTDLIVIFGLCLDPATQVEAYALIEAYAGFMTDLVTLVTSTP